VNLRAILFDVAVAVDLAFSQEHCPAAAATQAGIYSSDGYGMENLRPTSILYVTFPLSHHVAKQQER